MVYRMNSCKYPSEIRDKNSISVTLKIKSELSLNYEKCKIFLWRYILSLHLTDQILSHPFPLPVRFMKSPPPVLIAFIIS